ncbi:MAG TPA: hypothetical protein PLG27_01315 [Candidatus Latescibacteria bacterium]|jgi:hypothetical protein|nr:hypothetical protein [Candidatus Latescibacterota bacterium]HOT36961.1 hypothetical protein [Candidatus Latescibacterota bacterium]HPC46065.1 hypothetical protein [Candidatus Latescibacterota bacterium]HQE62494.1 hypothetical protein [Candidatus Latescibacterota bacterium]HQI76573.1 hypothetical protein [Candidatus Latescibacterota bacterium]
MALFSRRWALPTAILVAFLCVFASDAISQTTTLDSVKVVPNPYNVSGRTYASRSNIFGYERLRFANLPLPCTVKIYSSDANLVKTLQFNAGDLLPAWDGRNSDNQYIVSDVYFYVVEHATLGTKIGKFVVIR